tara:strand:- start:6482 stop:7156 length:675 start_codon:yes stop_codon:yes gene_type:complete
MHQQISKKIILYFFLFLLLGTVSNKYLSSQYFPKINSIIISGVDEQEKEDILKKLNFLKSNNLIFLKESMINLMVNSNEYIDTFSIFKKYPSTLHIEIKKAKILAKININGIEFLIGSNGKLIKKKIKPENIPQIFGNLDIQEFLKFKKILDTSQFNYKDIENLFFYPSRRWDIQTYQGVYIKLPKNEVEDSLVLLNNLFKDEEFEKIKIIDLRQNKQLVINER